MPNKKTELIALAPHCAPHCAPQCAGFVVICVEQTEPCVLLVETHKGIWGFPKGKRKKEESYESCAFRELFEETGLKSSDIQPRNMDSFCLYEITKKGFNSVKLYVATIDNKIVPIVEDVNEIKCAKWIKISDAYHHLLTLKNRKQILQDALAHLNYFV